MALFGVTFENQLLAEMDDGNLQEFLLKDGVIRGLTLSYNGSNLTIAAGYLIAAGRLIGNDSALTIAVPASAGYARIVLIIDLTGTATDSVFTQLSTRVDSEANVSDFPALTQGDINGGVDTTYEIALAIVQTSASGITGIESQLGAAGLKSILGAKSVTAEANGFIKMGTATPTAGTGTNQIAPGEIYLKYQ
jgi:hypothetical protein